MPEGPSDLYLSPNQQDLLMAALTSNQSATKDNQSAVAGLVEPQRTQRNSLTYTPGGLSDPSAPGSGRLDFSDDSPYLDFDLDGDIDDAYGYDSQGRMFGDLPTDDAQDGGHDLHEKRKSLDDKDDDDEGGGKRREGEDKPNKKPGRKPLTSEPTTKRKAQNRAAQRAFRERKEKHLKDLETKLEDYEKTSELDKHEKGLLRAENERLRIQVEEYRKRWSWMSNSGLSRSQSISNTQRNGNSGTNDFQFEFPKFGDLPATNIFSPPKAQQTQLRNPQRTSSGPAQSVASPPKPTLPRDSTPGSTFQDNRSKSGSIDNSPMANNMFTTSPQPFLGPENAAGVDSLTGLFSPSILEATKNSPFGYFPQQSNMAQHRNNVRTTSENSFSSVPGLYSHSSNSNTESPASSADSHQHSSSIGTSPEPNLSSPNNKLQDFSLNTINEENQLQSSFNDASTFGTDFDNSSINWLAQQNGGGFDPVLFGDYRETQENVLSQDFGSFFNDAYPLPDLGSPQHNYTDVSANAAEQPPKNDLMKQVDAAKDGEVVPGEASKMMTCNKIWDRLQSMEKFRNGEIDIDNLCSELRAKAKCSEGGAVVSEKHVNKILGL